MTHHHVDPDFDGMGYGYANDNGSPLDKETLGCIALWCAVIEDGFHHGAGELMRWVKSQDFKFVCELAGVQPSVLQMAARKIELGLAAVKPRQGTYERKQKR